MPIVLKPFQREVCDGILARFANVRRLYADASRMDAATQAKLRRDEAALVLEAPTGSGKTAIACTVLREWPGDERVLWFWFAPFAGLVEQARTTLRREAPDLAVFDLESDRRIDAIRGGGVFVSTWGAVAAADASARRARTRSDAGAALDDLIVAARAEGMRIGVVVDEAHHAFHKARQARALFRDVLAPDYALMMTATPRDHDVASFTEATGYRTGDAGDWASVSRADAVAAGLLKHGVRTVRFLARDADERQLVDFEQLALRECTAAHRGIQALLRDAGIPLTPLMLVQVPDGKAAQHRAAEFLTGTLGFAPGAVRIHTASEPDPDLIALAHDPSVEVLIFKMAVALGFDAPRAFTLAALRGARDADFGIQVIGRIARVQRLLRGRRDLPAALDYGYVFLANAESQEGLLDAGAAINAVTTQAPELGTQSIITVSGARSGVQLVASGAPLALLLGPGDSRGVLPAAGAPADAPAADPADGTAALEPLAPVASSLFPALDGTTGAPARPAGGQAATLLLRAPAAAFVHHLRTGIPALRTEWLPEPGSDYELKLADHVDFNLTVLGSRIRNQAAVQRHESDIFEQSRAHESERDIYARLSVAQVAERANDLLCRIEDANQREFRLRLLERFARAIEASHAEVPGADELDAQLDLVLVRNPHLLRDARRRVRQAELQVHEVRLPPELQSELPLDRAQRNAYGVFPADLNPDERRIAERLDSDPQVAWWHRNPAQKPTSVALYAWDEGEGFFPDFVVSIHQRSTPGGIALLEVKGEHLWAYRKEPSKADAEHPDYGRAFVTGHRRDEQTFLMLRRGDHRLEPDGNFSIDRMRWT